MLRHALILSGIALLVVAIVIWQFTRPDIAQLSEIAVTGKTPELSAPRPQFFPTMAVAQATGWPSGGKPKAAAGLQVTAFAGGLDHPRWLYRLPNGDILVAETNSPPRNVGGVTGAVMGSLMKKAGAGGDSPNRIVLLRDTDGNGTADQRSVLLSGLNSPFGMALLKGWLYVANTDALVRYPFTPGETKITAKPEKILALAGGGNHWARNVVAAPDGNSLFVSVGSSSNIAENGLEAEGGLYARVGQPDEMAKIGTVAQGARAAILEVNPDTKATRVFAWGLRNPNGMAFEPHSKSLWTVVNERDMLGSDMPPDYLTQVDFGAFYGWPWAYWGGYPDKRVQPEQPGMLEYVKRPDFALGAHVAPLGLAFASDAKLGPGYANGAFIGLHGSWNREPVSGYKVVYVPFGDDGFPAKGAKPRDLLTGFLSADGKALGRPVGVITDASGALLVADDVGNMIWRVSAGK
ncbi:sorbosone dehydrogenase family protein [Sphingomonas sp.]|uniref:PQQ-dependent sugar dehydrogenase n=1 Tax=Sphingomonas sp. TaxID=28214 RepID=UPI001B111486|nr:sorbosone dehydrogenase family protein [Sphingomonas sp.]MBO9714862.1 sorbosone dehydrogenase family protein [Sphingomonas sp.]